MAEHNGRPTGEWAEDGSGTCIRCGGRLIEAIYTGGWMHSIEEPHPFHAFVYGDGTRQVGGGCTACGRIKDHALHA